MSVSRGESKKRKKIRKEDSVKKRSKSEVKALKEQEKQIQDQTKTIRKQDQELTKALYYVNDLEEELLNLKINSLYVQSAVCSPKN